MSNQISFGNGLDDGSISLLHLPTLLRRTGLSRSHICKLIQQGAFPRPVKIGRMSGWVSHEIDGWLVEMIQFGRPGGQCVSSGSSQSASPRSKRGDVFQIPGLHHDQPVQHICAARKLGLVTYLGYSALASKGDGYAIRALALRADQNQ